MAGTPSSNETRALAARAMTRRARRRQLFEDQRKAVRSSGKRK